MLLLMTVDVLFVLLMLFVLRLPQTLTRMAGIQEMVKLLIVSVGACLPYAVFLFVSDSITVRFAILQILFFSFLFMIVMFSSRFFRNGKVYFQNLRRNNLKRVVIIGAGTTGGLLASEMLTKPELGMTPVCFLDDAIPLQGAVLHGVRVMGTIDDIGAISEQLRPDRIVVAIPSASRKRLSQIYEACSGLGVEVMTLPAMSQLLSGQVSATRLRNVDAQDLLGRDSISVDMDGIERCISGKVVLVTGGGGSIGSEICRQVAEWKPRLLIVFDIYENNAYDIEQELRRKYPELPLLTLIGSIRDEGRVNTLFEQYRPQIVFNAAAHKHVPLMENSPNEAVKNNVFGTLNLARAADRYGTERFVQISTDKAVNPTNIMGATKRICEMIIQTIGRHSKKTNFVAVRFGNVLGSNGSVIPLFKKQIAEGGPVTLTDPGIVRYFMTIPEAVSLVLQACCYAHAGEIFVFDMGEPVKIYDLAVNLIRLCGYEPNVDIDIKCIGLRPGEKLYEERLMAEEGLQKTANDKILIGKPIEINEEAFFRALSALYDAAYEETDQMKYLVRELVPTYQIDERKA